LFGASGKNFTARLRGVMRLLATVVAKLADQACRDEEQLARADRMGVAHLTLIDFAKVAEGFGVESFRADEFSCNMQKALEFGTRDAELIRAAPHRGPRGPSRAADGLSQRWESGARCAFLQ
jgi:hypothetical protein